MLCCKKKTNSEEPCCPVQFGYVNPVEEGGWISTPPQKGGSENQHVHPMYPTPRPLKEISLMLQQETMLSNQLNSYRS